jgi:DNA-binding NarL/FixJ family response regulator
METCTRTVIVDDHLLFLESIRALLNNASGVEVVGQATDVAGAVRVVGECRPDLLILDFSLPPQSGLDVLRQLADAGTSVPTLMISAGVSDDDILEALSLGARGVILKHVTPDLLVRAIAAVRAGQYWIGRDRVGGMVRQLRAENEQNANVGPDGLPMEFTPRQVQIMSAIASGSTNRGIAEELSIRPTTVKYHLAQLFEKTGTNNRVALARVITMRSLHTPRIRKRRA